MELMTEFFNALSFYSIRVALAIAVFFLFFLIAQVLSRLIKRLGQKKSIKTSRIYLLLAGSQKIITLLLGAVTALGTLGVNISALVASLGLTGFALGFALKDALSNLLAGVMIILYQPFDIGDTIKVLGSTGEVVDINLRYTTLETENSTILIPNSACLLNKISKQS